MNKSSNETEVEVDEKRPEFTICNKTLRGNPKTIIDYLYEQGRCNCRTSKKEFAKSYIHYNKNVSNIDIMRRKFLPNHYVPLFDLLRAQMHLHERFIKTIRNWRK